MPSGVYVRTKLRYGTLAERFWMNVVCDLASGCWLWTGGTFSNGYGSISMDGTPTGAHRVSWFLCYGVLPTQWVLHHCDTPRCVRPDHLFLGDHEANMRDMVDKGRSRRGQRTNLAKLTDQQVIEMRQRFRDGATRMTLAAEYGLDHSTVAYIIRRATWAHLP